MEQSLVLEMQRLAMDPKPAVADVVRAALVVATKLDVSEFRKWCELELNGYSVIELPAYRKIQGELKAWNPVRREYIPVIMGGDSELVRKLSSRAVVQRIGELDLLYKGADSDRFLQMPLSPEITQAYFAQTHEYRRLGFIPTVLIGPTQIFGILEAVRNTVLEWSLRLEKDGIIGRGMTFSAEEKQAAGHTTYNIGQFTGVLGSVSTESLQIGDYNSIRSELKRLGVPQGERNEIEEIMDELPKANAKVKKSLLGRGAEWLRKNGPVIGALSGALRDWFEMFK